MGATDEQTTRLSACGRTVGATEVEQIRELVELCSGLSRHELALTLCEHWGWVGATGKLQCSACKKVLERLEREGLVKLPAKRENMSRPGWQSVSSRVSAEETAPSNSVVGDLRSVGPVVLEQVKSKEEEGLWRGYVERYHPLGAKRAFGLTLRYFVTSGKGRLGCVQVASGARALRLRDEWIGWNVQQRLSNLPLVVNNSRFLLFPWVRVRHLASHVLGQLARQIESDWQGRWGYAPVLLETFVDPEQYEGTCYRAAGWELLGETTGSGLKLRGHAYRTSRKLIFVRALARDFRQRLQSPPQERREEP